MSDAFILGWEEGKMEGVTDLLAPQKKTHAELAQTHLFKSNTAIR